MTDPERPSGGRARLAGDAPPARDGPVAPHGRTHESDAAKLVARQLDRLLRAHDPQREPAARFWAAQYDHGLAWVHFPVGLGGLGVGPSHQATVASRLGALGAPRAFDHNPIGVGMVAAVLVAYAGRERAARHLRALFTGREIWCQLFSEPGAGSDVASLATQAVRDADHWVVTGEKVWTTLAHVASFGLLLARTDPHMPKHRGLTAFVCDMHAPGVTVRPLQQLTGDSEFNEVHLNGVVVPDANRLGEVGNGWRVATTTLLNERVAIGGGIEARGAGPIAEAVRLLRARPVPASLREEVARLWMEAEVHRLTNLRAQHHRESETPGPEGSVAKLRQAELHQRIWECCLELLGPEGLLLPESAEAGPEGSPDSAGRASPTHSPPAGSPERDGGPGTDGRSPARPAANVQKAFLRSRAHTIEGGTSEIMRNILGERVLGLPAEPRLDKDRPWSDVPRS